MTKSATIALCSMARESGDPTAVGSSIVLLQERFRQLQKMKEKREGRELLKLFSESEQITTTPSKCSDPERTVYTSRPPPRDSLSLGLDLYNKHADFRPIQTPPSTNLWSAGAAKVSKSYSYEKSDVDTSLHL